jgi:hypothetical protein
MRRIANSRRSIAGVLISLAVALAAAAEPVSAWASQGSPGCF